MLLLGCAAVAGRLLAGRAGPIARDESLWTLRYDVRFDAQQPNARVHVALPEDTQHCGVFRETFSHTGLSVDVLRTKQTGGRDVVAAPAEQAGESQLTAEFHVRLSPGTNASAPPRTVLSTEDRAYYLRSEEDVPAHSPEVVGLASRLSERRSSQDRLLSDIFEYCSSDIERGDSAATEDGAEAIRLGVAGPVGRARAMVALCRAARMPARLAAGFIVRSQKDARPHVWVEVYSAKRWMPYDPAYGYARELPANYLPVRRDGASIVRSAPGCDVQAAFSLQRLGPGSAFPSLQEGSLLDVFDLSRLPTGMQQTLAILLLLPVGVLITALFRNIIGLQTFGTFTPALLGLSFLYSDWRTATVVLVLMIGIGLSGRALLNRLQLLMVPRLSVVLTLVVLCLVVAVSLLARLGLTPSAQAVILPLVITTMMIERFYIKAEEDGFRSSLKVFASTLIVAGCCLALLGWERLGQLAVRFPEAELFVAAALLAIGRYCGYRLSELLRFRDLARTPDMGA